MSGVWLTHPALTPGHDFKAANEMAAGIWAASGWQVREDQSDPAPEVDETSVVTPDAPAPAPTFLDQPAPADEPDLDELDDDSEPITTSTKKG